MVRNIQDLLYGGAHVGTKKITDISFAYVAQEMGFAYSRRIEKRDELQQGMEDFVSAEGASFLEVVTDVDEMLYPRIPAGLGYKDMILGPHMK